MMLLPDCRLTCQALLETPHQSVESATLQLVLPVALKSPPYEYRSFHPYAIMLAVFVTFIPVNQVHLDTIKHTESEEPTLNGT